MITDTRNIGPRRMLRVGMRAGVDAYGGHRARGQPIPELTPRLDSQRQERSRLALDTEEPGEQILRALLAITTAQARPS